MPKTCPGWSRSGREPYDLRPGAGGAGFQGQGVVNHGAGLFNGRGTAGLHAGLPVVAGHAVVEGVAHRFRFDDAEEGDGQAEELSGNQAWPADTTRDGRKIYLRRR